MKLGNLIQARKTIAAHSQEAISVPLAYKLMKFMKASDDEDSFYVGKIREIVASYKDATDVGGATQDEFRIPKSKVQEFEKAVNELKDSEVEAPSIKFALAELSELKLSVTEMFSLDNFIIEEE